MTQIRAVIWDFGGVVTSSPFEAFAQYEATHGLPENFIRSVNSVNPDTNAWARFERAEIDAPTFSRLFGQESKALGHQVAGADVLALLSGTIRVRVVDALKALKGRYKLGCITNNVPAGHGPGMAGTMEKAEAVHQVMALFDHVIESAKLGIRKPDPRIYELMCEALAVSPQECLFLDDLGINLKPAKAMGMATIKVTSEAQLLYDLGAMLGETF
jgi:putative hydrolase of the HAD superfamily